MPETRGLEMPEGVRDLERICTDIEHYFSAELPGTPRCMALMDFADQKNVDDLLRTAKNENEKAEAKFKDGLLWDRVQRRKSEIPGYFDALANCDEMFSDLRKILEKEKTVGNLQHQTDFYFSEYLTTLVSIVEAGTPEKMTPFMKDKNSPLNFIPSTNPPHITT